MLRAAVPAVMFRERTVGNGLVVAVTALVLLATVPTVALAETRAEGTTVVEAGETVGDLTALSGSVVVRGTVDGDLTALSGTVVVEEGGVVTGDLSGAAGSVRVDGRVDGSVSAGAGSVTVGSSGVIGGDLSVGASDVRVDGRVDGDAVLGAGRVELGPGAVVGGDLRYDEDATFVRDPAATVGGAVVAEASLGEVSPFVLPWWVGVVYGTLASLLLGLALLVVAPRTSRSVADRVATEPVRSLGVGLLTVVVVPVALVALALTIVGIPLTLLGAVLFGLLAWVALVYGRFAVAVVALSRVGVDDRFVAMAVGVVGLGLVAAVPVLGGLVDVAVSLLGLGALVTTAVAARRRRETTETAPATDRGSGVA